MTTYLDFTCSECGNDVSVDEDVDGKPLPKVLTHYVTDFYVECPNCGTEFLIEISVEFTKEKE